MNLGRSIKFFPTFSEKLGVKVKKKLSAEALVKYGTWYPFFFYDWTILIRFPNESR